MLGKLLNLFLCSELLDFGALALYEALKQSACLDVSTNRFPVQDRSQLFHVLRRDGLCHRSL
jgi:hypothetical protein